MTPFSTCSEQELLSIRDFLVNYLAGKVVESSNVPGLSFTMRIDSREDAQRELLLIGQELYRLDPCKYKRARRITQTVMRQAFDDATNRSNH